MATCDQQTVTQADLDNLVSNIEDIDDWAGGGPDTTVNLGSAGTPVPSPSKLIADAKLFKAPVAYNAGTQYTDATQPVTQGGIVYAPQPSALPIGPEAFDSNNWYVLQGASAGDVNEWTAQQIFEEEVFINDLLSVEGLDLLEVSDLVFPGISAPVAGILRATHNDSKPGWVGEAKTQTWHREVLERGRYLGTFASDPVTRPDGRPLQGGDVYHNSGDDKFYKYPKTAGYIGELAGLALNTWHETTRGVRPDFPEFYSVTLKSNKVIVYDMGTGAPIFWRSWANGAGSTFGAATFKNVDAGDGQIITGTSSGAFVIDLITDEVHKYSTAGHETQQDVITTDAESLVVVSAAAASQIVNNSVNAVERYLSPNSFDDPSRGAPYPTYAFGTDGGVSMGRYDAGGAITFTDSSSTLGVANVAFDSGGGVYYSRNQLTGILYYSTAADYQAGDGFGDEIARTTAGTNDFDLLTYRSAANCLRVGADGALIFGGSTSSGGAIPGLARYYPDTSDFTKTMGAVTTDVYATPPMQGDVELCLSGNALVDRSVTGTVITDNGAATFVDVNTNADLQSTTAVGGTITAPVTTGGECYGWEKVSGIWYFRSELSEWVGVSEAAGVLTIADGTEFTLLAYVNGAGPTSAQKTVIEEYTSPMFWGRTLLRDAAVISVGVDKTTGVVYAGTPAGVQGFKGGVEVYFSADSVSPVALDAVSDYVLEVAA
jgi:hypothetical protein